MMDKPLRIVPASWSHAVLVCAKCTRKLGGGFGPKGRTSLAKALRARLNARKGRKAPVGIVETNCLKLCPAKAVVVVDSRAPGRWLLVPPAADLAEISAALGIGSAETPGAD